MNLPPPFDTFRLEKRAGEYKDFQVAEGDPYPLKGVTYPVNYGDIAGYIGEDNHDLDIFVGNEGDVFGFIQVSRPDVEGGKETKFYLFLTEDEEDKVLSAFDLVLIEYGRYKNISQLTEAVEKFKNN